MSTPNPSSSWQRWALFGFVFVLMAEYLVVSLFFDVGPLRRATGWYRGLGYLGILAPMFLAMATAIALLHRRILVTLRERLSATKPSWWLLVPHFVVYALFLLITARSFSGGKIESGWMAVWLVLGLAFPLLLVRVALPYRALLQTIRPLAPALAGGAAVGVLAWGAGLAAERLWDPLGWLTLRAVIAMLAGITDDTVFVPSAETLIGTSDFSVRVAPVCSGYEGIGLILVFLGAYLWLFRGAVRWPRAWWLFPLAVFTVWIANVVRILGLIVVGSWLSPEIALGGFHSKAGWLIFCVVAFAFVALSRRSRWFSTDQEDAEAYENPVFPYLAPMVVVLLTVLVTGMFASGVDLLYPARVVTGGLVILFVAPRSDLAGAPSPVAVLVGVAVFVLWVGTANELETPLAAEISAMPTVAMVAWLMVRAVGTILVIPIAEELAFRGYLLRRLVRREFTEVAMTRFSWWAVLISSVAFGALHQRYLVGTAAGVLFALAMLHRGRLRDAVYAHAICNGLLVIYAVATGRWGLWF